MPRRMGVLASEPSLNMLRDTSVRRGCGRLYVWLLSTARRLGERAVASRTHRQRPFQYASVSPTRGKPSFGTQQSP
jgi:hypothetical protein